MNRLWLLLPIAMLALGPAAAADMSVPARARTARVYDTAPGPLGACRIYKQGHYAACEITTEPACQRLSERGRYSIASRRWYALPQGLAWDMPRC